VNADAAGRPDSADGRGVVFDLDGVLVESEHLWEESWVAYARDHDYAWTQEDTRTCQGMSVQEWGEYLAARAGVSTDAAADGVVDLVASRYESGEVELMDGAYDMVVHVAKTVPVALASSAPRRIIETVMNTMGMGPYFSATVSSAEVPRGKPSPDVYTEAIRRLGVDAIGSFAVEDSSNGIRAASRAGLTVVAVPAPRYALAPDAAELAVSVQHNLIGVRDELSRLLAAQPLSG